MANLIKKLKQAYCDGKEVAVCERMKDTNNYFSLDILAKMPDIPARSALELVSSMTDSSIEYNNKIVQIQSRKRNFFESLAYNLGHSNV